MISHATRFAIESENGMLKYSGSHYSVSQLAEGGCRLMTRMRDDEASPRPALTDLAFHILIALGKGPAHGYAIGKDVEEQSGGRLDASTGTLYQALHRLKEEGLIASVDPPECSDERRKYFRLTERGRRAAEAEARRLHALVRTARKRKLYPQRT
jgi:DNA-binding PadR family transcriptional regulator